MTLTEHADRHAMSALVFETMAKTYSKPGNRDDGRKDHIRWLQLQAAQCRMAEASARMEAASCPTT